MWHNHPIQPKKQYKRMSIGDGGWRQQGRSRWGGGVVQFENGWQETWEVFIKQGGGQNPSANYVIELKHFCANIIQLSEIDRQALGCVFLVVRCNIIKVSFMRKQEGKSESQKKYKEEFVRGTLLFWPPSCVIFFSFFVYYLFLPKSIKSNQTNIFLES